MLMRQYLGCHPVSGLSDVNHLPMC
jgi:hypothetical protein